MTEYIFKIISLLGGLALFLFGMDVMGKALQRTAGGKLQNILAKIQAAVDNGDLVEDKAYDWFLNAWQKIDPNTMSAGMRMEMIKKYPVLGESYTDENGEWK